jgi:DNA-binding MarR family transcriptional regulator
LKRSDFDLSEYVPYLINRVGASLVECFMQDARVAKTQLSTIGLWRLLVVMSNHAGTRQVDLSKLTSIPRSNVSRLVTRLIELGLVNRARSTESNREVVVELTSKGKMLVAKLVPVALKIEDVAMRGVSKQDLIATKRVLRQIHRNLAGDPS